MMIPRLLRADEISCRVQQVTESKGAIILLYKDARVDMNILDETYGPMNWKREHHTIDGNLFCTISVWDMDKREWVSKQDVGVESYTEATKGEASDAFKRAGFNWAIGRELYTGPFIFVQLEDGEWSINQRTNKPQATFRFGLSVKEITYTDEKAIKTLVLVDKNNRVRFTHGKGKVQNTIPVPIENSTKAPKEVPKEVPANVVKQRNDELKTLLTEKNKTVEDYKALAGDKTVSNMTGQEYLDWFNQLKAAWQ